MNKLIAFLGASAVGLGALGAHTLAGFLDEGSLESLKPQSLSRCTYNCLNGP